VTRAAPASSTALVRSAGTELPHHAGSLAFSIAADARLRIWDLVSCTCVREIELPASSAAHSSAAGEALEAFAPGARPLLKAYATDGGIRLLVHAPLSARRFFLAYDVALTEETHGAAAVADVTLLWAREEGEATRRASLCDAWLDEGAPSTLWGLWEGEGEPLLASLAVDESEQTDAAELATSDEARGWQVCSTQPCHPPLHGAAFDAALQDAGADLSEFLVPRLFHGGRFLEHLPAVLDAYLDRLEASISPEAPRPAVLSPDARYASLQEEVAATVGAGVGLERDPSTGALQVEAYEAALRREWTAFVSSLEQAESESLAPLCLVPRAAGVAPHILTAGALVVPSLPDAAGILVRAVQLEAAAARARGRAADRALAQRDAFITDAARSATLSEDESFSRAMLLLVSAGARLESALPPGSCEDFEELVAAALAPGADDALLDVGSGIFAELAVDESALEAARAACGRLGEDLEPALWALGNAVVSGGSGVPEAAGSQSPLGIALLADATLRSLHARRQLARLLSLVLLAIEDSDALDLDPDARSALTSRALVSLHDLVGLLDIAALPAVREVDVREPSEDEKDDAVANSLGRMSMDAPSSDGTAQEANGEARNLLHLLLLRRLLPLFDAEAPNAAAAHLIAASGLLGPPPAGEQWHSRPAPTLALRTEAELNRALCTLANELLLLGHPSAAMQLLDHYAPCAARAYVRGRALLALGALDEASVELATVAPMLDSYQMLLQDEELGASGTGLLALMPRAVREESDPSRTIALYHAHISDLFASVSPLDAANFASLALAYPSERTTELHHRVFRARLAAGDFEGAHECVVTAPTEAVRRECLRGLVGTMCEAGEVAHLLALSFPGMQAEMERTLSFKARNSDPLGEPNYYRILYAYHMHRGDLKSGECEYDAVQSVAADA
jgi:nuclear pore complex protein Nup160